MPLRSGIHSGVDDVGSSEIIRDWSFDPAVFLVSNCWSSKIGYT